MDDAQPIGCAASFRTEARRFFRRASFFAVCRRSANGASTVRGPRERKDVGAAAPKAQQLPNQVRAPEPRGSPPCTAAKPTLHRATPPHATTKPIPNRRKAHPALRQSPLYAAPYHPTPHCRKNDRSEPRRTALPQPQNAPLPAPHRHPAPNERIRRIAPAPTGQHDNAPLRMMRSGALQKGRNRSFTR